MSQTTQASAGRGVDWLQRAARQFLTRFKDLSRDELQGKPTAGGWSRQQVVQHMLMAYSGTVAELERRLAKGSPSQRMRTPKERVAQFMLIRCGYFPPGRKAPQFVNPDLSKLAPLDGAELAAEYRRQVGELESALDKVQATWGNSRSVATHPVLGPLSVPQWRKFHAVHTLHHCKQLDRISAAPKTAQS